MLTRQHLKSKTLWANAILALTCALVPGAEDFIAKHPVAAINLFSVLQALLNRKRKTYATVTPIVPCPPGPVPPLGKL